MKARGRVAAVVFKYAAIWTRCAAIVCYWHVSCLFIATFFHKVKIQIFNSIHFLRDKIRNIKKALFFRAYKIINKLIRYFLIDH